MPNTALQTVQSIADTCRTATVDGIELVVSRFEKNDGYPFIDTKLSTITGENFPEPADLEADFRGRSAVFGWIQGRGLEALAGHATYLAERESNAVLAARCDRMLDAVATRIAAFAAANRGRFVFLFTPDGRPFRCGADGRREYVSSSDVPPGFADLFTAKGLAAAGVRRKRSDWSALGIATFRAATEAINKGTFASDQISFDPKNPAVPVPGRVAQGPWMIALGGYALLCELFPESEEWVAGGAAYLRRVVDRHVALCDDGPLKRFDFVEAIDVAGKPWMDQGKIVQDPGHALEFTGLAARFLLNAKAHGNRADFAALKKQCQELLPEVFLAAFANGFQPSVGGVCKTFDLVARKPINDDMPWWQFPETLRAAALLLRLAPAHPRRDEVASAAIACARAFFGPYRSVRPGLFYQTRDARGEPTPVVPATPDADPGYHTGLCLIDVVDACREKR